MKNINLTLTPDQVLALDTAVTIALEKIYDMHNIDDNPQYPKMAKQLEGLSGILGEKLSSLNN